MNATHSHEMIDVQALRVGMFVHLDGGWMAHPFPLSRFRLMSAEQIATIRSLGLMRVRWEPSLSDVAGQADGEANPTQTPQGADPVAAVASIGDPATQSPEHQSRSAHRRRLAQQREALALCERQFAEASGACAQLPGLVPASPLDAASHAQALSRALVDKMVGDEALCIQLLSRDAGTKPGAHELNVTIVALLLGRKLGLSDEQMLDLGVGAMLHDIGKIKLPSHLREREEHFNAAQMKRYEDHVALGVEHARKMGLSAPATLVIAQHHERADRGGFPLKLAGEKLTLLARIVALVNRYDKLCNPPLLAMALTPHDALAQMFAAQRSHFDPIVMGTFIKMMGVYPPGSTVQLSDDRFALVVNVNSTRPLKPRLLVHDASVPREDALLVDLEHMPELSIRRSIKPLALPPPALDYLAPAPRVLYFFEPARESGGDS
jgi:putative nucleotidyltransferase with HDIG domain